MNDIFSHMFGRGGFNPPFSRGGGAPFGQEMLLHPPILIRAKMPPVSLSYPSMKLKQEGNSFLNLQNLYLAATEALQKSR